MAIETKRINFRADGGDGIATDRTNVIVDGKFFRDKNISEFHIKMNDNNGKEISILVDDWRTIKAIRNVCNMALYGERNV